jgi:hypothetical protein
MELFPALAQGQQTASQEIAGGIAARVDEQKEVEQELGFRHRTAFDLRMNQPARQVRARVSPFLGDQPRRIGEHGGHRFTRRPRADRFRRRVDRLGKPVQFAPILGRKSHQLGDHVGWHFAGHVGDEVALFPIDDPVDNAGCELGEPTASVVDSRGREFSPKQLPKSGLTGRVHHQHHLRLAEDVPLLRRWVGDHDGRL